MTEKQNLIDTIEYLADRVANDRGSETAVSAFNGNDISGLEDLSIGELWEILGNLQQMDAD